MQSGQVYRLGRSWAYRYRTPDGKRPQKGGFRTKGEARAALTEALGRLSRGTATGRTRLRRPRSSRSISTSTSPRTSRSRRSAIGFNMLSMRSARRESTG